MNLTCVKMSVLLFILCIPALSICQTPEDINRVENDTLTLNPRIKPVKNATTTLRIQMDFNLISIQELDTVKQKLISSGWLNVMWDNELVKWNGLHYGNTYVLVNPDPNKLWRPRLCLSNTMKDLRPFGENYIFMMLMYNGTTYWYPSDKFETFCRVDVTYFPFDVQRCNWEIFFWGADLVDLTVGWPYIKMDAFTSNGEWEVLSTKAFRVVKTLNGFTIPYIYYQITIRRRPNLLALTLILPVISLALVNVFVFTIPSESGERLSYSVTLLLSFGVFMSFIVNSMPSSSETTSYLAIHMSFLLVLSALYVLLCIYSVSLFHRNTAKYPVPPAMQSFIVCLEIVFCMGPPRNLTKIKPVDIGLKSADDFANGDGGGGSGGGGGGGGGGGLGRGELGSKGLLAKWLMIRKHEQLAYNDPEEMTWPRVSRSLDKFFFRFFSFLVLLSIAIVWGVMFDNYFNNHD